MTQFYKINDSQFRVCNNEVGVNQFRLLFTEDKTKVSVVGIEYIPVLLEFTKITEIKDSSGFYYTNYDSFMNAIEGFNGELSIDYDYSEDYNADYHI